jgi:hypothetical protein
MNTFRSCLLGVLLLNVTSCVLSATIKVKSTARTAPYLVRDPFYSVSDPSVNRLSSEHFQIIWGRNDTSGMVTRQFVQGNLDNMESIRSFFIEGMGLKDIGHSKNPAVFGTYKMNIYIAVTGLSQIQDNWAYMSVDRDTFAFVVMMPAGMRVDPPSWVVPHELGHAFIYHNGGIVPYYWNEGIANFLRNEYLFSTYYSYGGTVYGPTADFFAPYVLNSEVHFPHMKNWYDTWPILLYINENPDHINGLGHQALLNLLTYKKEDPSYFKIIADATGVSIKEILGGLTRRMVTMDFKAQRYYLTSFEELLRNQENVKKIYTTLLSGSDGWMIVPGNRAPQQTGYNIVPLTGYANKASVTVNFQGTSTEKNADWRVSIVTAANNGATRYSSMWNKGNISISHPYENARQMRFNNIYLSLRSFLFTGTNTMILRGDEKAVYLVVAATPDNIVFLDLEQNGVTYPYQVKVTMN